MPAGAVSLVGLVNPVVGTLLGVAVAGEAFGWVQAVGMVLVLGGVVAGQRRASGERAKRKISDERRRLSTRSVEMCDAA
jgi:probable blue pigment (indigoidine) exporter